jgi:hypothetical protein
METKIEYYMSGARGLWYGFLEGLYNTDNPFIPEDCLDEEMSLKMARIVYSAESFQAMGFV